jgi:divalent metal cation (Fe/Co/Zn/Cd) transporter
LNDARRARLLSWLSLVWMTVEGGLGVLAGVMAGSVALVGFGLSSGVEGLAAVIVIWRFTGSRTHSDSSERSAQRAVAISFWLLAPYVAVEAVHKLVTAAHPETSVLGIALTTSSLVLMPLLGRAKLRLGERLGSVATAGEGTQNVLCAMLAGAVLAGLLAQTLFGAWWFDPLAALFVAAVAVREGLEAWRGEACVECSPVGFDGPAADEDGCCDSDGASVLGRERQPDRVRGAADNHARERHLEAG